MTDLLAFLAARLDEDERVARAAAGGGRWSYPGSDSVAGWALYDEAWVIANLKTYEHETYDYAARMPAMRDPRYVDADANGRHIARHDPARVLREVEAKRALLALHPHRRFAEPLDANSRFEEDHRPAFTEAPRYVGCEGCNIDRYEEVYPSWWCAHVRLLAAPYADHPDYREEWALPTS
ncbi:DUF6221 family protein [Dactylosporangium sp. CA-052675]|uniref:DUF6221 family protein n=1 Tax=Dactylosporangium sp. CA-052675 TaxID=3239927 RepID=UPI003D8F9268